MKKKWKMNLTLCLSVILLVVFTACGAQQNAGSSQKAEAASAAVTAQSEEGGNADGSEAAEEQAAEETAENAGAGRTTAKEDGDSDGQKAVAKNGEIMILFTSDIHCGVKQGFGLVGLQQVRDTLEAQGYTTILVDDGDAIQGETIGTVTNGEGMIELMNAMKYDVAIPGNHEYDYGTERFLELAEMADFPYVSCNFTKEGELVFDPYKIIEAEGIKIAFVGVTTPQTITSSTPAHFMNDQGEFIYGFMQDQSGEKLYQAVQKAVDGARTEGVDYVYLIGHLGMLENSAPWRYSDVISHTSGIDVVLDGHSHDTVQDVMKNKDGEAVIRSACGTKLNCIGYSHISQDGIAETNIWNWPNSVSVPDMLGIKNGMSDVVASVMEEVNRQTENVIAKTDFLLTIYDPEEKDSNGHPIRVIRSAETNLGDLIADALRVQTDAEIGLIGGGGIRTNIEKGEITYGDILSVQPFQNNTVVVKATGQQILDALEWGTKNLPGEFGGFLHVSGLSYEVDVSVPSGCKKDENGMMTGIEGERRVKNVMVGEEPIDPEKNYTVAGTDYVLTLNGDGSTAFDGAEILIDSFKVDSQLLIDYLQTDLGGVVSEEYADPYGQGRIKIIE